MYSYLYIKIYHVKNKWYFSLTIHTKQHKVAWIVNFYSDKIIASNCCKLIETDVVLLSIKDH